MELVICPECGAWFDNESNYCKCLQSLYKLNRKFYYINRCHSIGYRSYHNYRRNGINKEGFIEIPPRKTLI